MSPEMVVQILREAFLAAMWLALPILAIGFVVGVVMSLLQIVTSIQDTAFSTVPRLLAFLGGLLLLLPWMVSRSVTYTALLFSDLGRYAK